MINFSSFECEIADKAVDVFIAPSRRDYASRGGDDPHLFVVLPSFSFKVKLTSGNLAALRRGVQEWGTPSTETV